jgi:uncharacterized protein (DUF983 family)
MKIRTLLVRCLRLRCPICGKGLMFAGYFRMYPQCDQCGFRYASGQGYFLGSIYFNYGVTAVIVLVAYLSLMLTDSASPEALLIGLTAFCVLFPLWFFRYARSLWLALDCYFDPERRRQRPPAANP